MRACAWAGARAPTPATCRSRSNTRFKPRAPRAHLQDRLDAVRRNDRVGLAVDVQLRVAAVLAHRLGDVREVIDALRERWVCGCDAWREGRMGTCFGRASWHEAMRSPRSQAVHTCARARRHGVGAAIPTAHAAARDNHTRALRSVVSFMSRNMPESTEIVAGCGCTRGRTAEYRPRAKMPGSSCVCRGAAVGGVVGRRTRVRSTGRGHGATLWRRLDGHDSRARAHTHTRTHAPSGSAPSR